MSLKKVLEVLGRGSIGHIHRGHGIADWNILIRTLEAHSGPEKWHATVQAGGGIVIGSSPAEEVEEARWKASKWSQSQHGASGLVSQTRIYQKEEWRYILFLSMEE